MELNLEIANEISAKTPNLCHLAPAGPTYMEDLNEAGGVYAVMNELSKRGLLNLDCLTANGTTVGENIKNCVNKNPEVIRPVENPYSQTGGIAVLKGNLAPDSGVVKRSAWHRRCWYTRALPEYSTVKRMLLMPLSPAESWQVT